MKFAFRCSEMFARAIGCMHCMILSICLHSLEELPDPVSCGSVPESRGSVPKPCGTHFF